MADVHVGDIGTCFRLTVLRSDGTVESQLGSATVRRIKLKDPSGTTTTKTATLYTNGSDGKMQYTTTAATELATAGTWQVQGYIELGGGKWHTSIASFNVVSNL